MQPLLAEAFRLHLLAGLEDELRQSGFRRIAGVDEVGRGCLAGPVVAAAVIVDERRLVPGVDDSKRLDAPAREALSVEIRRAALGCAVASVSATEIDRGDILRATRTAMELALRALRPSPDCAVIDAVAIPWRSRPAAGGGIGYASAWQCLPGEGGGAGPASSRLPFPCLPVVRADALSYAVASASVVAKVERDRMMGEYDRTYPQYGFAHHKGYAVPEHRRAIAAYGPCPIHRLTFGTVVPRIAEEDERTVA
jgi:ribonuclease HII